MARFFAAFLGAFLIFGVLFSALVLYIGPAQEEALPELYPAPEITLTDARGESFSSDTLAGKVWVVDLFFTSCATMCPIMTDNLTKVMAPFADNPDVHFVSISVDPETDTPERMTEYAGMYEADLDRWHFLTGPVETVGELSVKGLKLGSMDDPTQHSDRYVLVDRHGMIRAYYRGTEAESVADLTRDIERLLKE